MRKHLAILILFFSFIKTSAQLDTEHWFAPMYNSIGSDNSLECYLYLSTNETTPFIVDIYNNNTIVSSINIAKNQPGIYSVPYQYLFTNQNTDVLKSLSKGLFLSGSKKFFANVRFQVPSQAEIITSKGKAALGKLFYSVNSPLPRTETYFNFSTSVIATENNTNIKISNINPNIVFFNNSSSSQLNFTLNKGESYIIAGSGNNANNLDTFIGAKIESDKPIAVVNGNLGASVSTNNNNSRDFYVDESVPTERLGDKFAVMKGNGDIGYLMEEPMVVATKNNTQIYLNDETTPYSFTKNGTVRNYLNEGEYVLIDEAKYIDKGNGVYNMSINTNQNVYIYQNLAGISSGSIYATGGFNYIPPLNCFLPKEIDEIAKINEIGTYQYETKLNIITQKGAIVTLNGTTLSGINGPYSITGNNDWEMYSVNNVTSNIAVKSTKSVTVGIAAGSGNIGYGGYFAGFNSNPIISKGGDCDKGNITLEVDDTYDSYQWYYNGVPYTGTGANTYIINPTESGEYYVKIVKTNCGTLDSPVFGYQRCPFKSSNSVDISNCNPTYITPIPQFSTSTQTVDISTVKITTPPTNGTVSINATTGEITYTLTNFSATTDTFTYSFSSTDPKFPDTEYVTVNIKVNYLKVFAGETFACIKPDKTGDFDLTKAVVTNDTNISSIEYYENYNASTKTFSNFIPNFTNYNSLPKIVYAKVTNSYGCIDVAPIELKFYPIPNIDTVKYNSTLCDTDLDGLYEPDFDEISKTIVNNSSDFDIYYFDNAGYNFPALPKTWTYSTPTRVYVLVASKNGCTNATGFIDFKIGTKLTVNNISSPVCDNDLDGKTDTKISDHLPAAATGTSYHYYDTFAKAQEAKPGNTALDSQQITATKTFYIRAENPAFCPNIFELQITFNQPKTSPDIKDLIICKNATTIIDAGNNFTYYKWSNGTEGAALQTATYGAGNHFVELSSNGCVYKQTFTITEAVDPKFDSVIELGNSITVNVSGGNPPYEYSLDNTNWQTSNVFNNLKRGLQTVYVRDTNKCTPIEYEFLIFNQINAITPNGDGVNDVLDYSDLRVKKDVKILIFDRYGKQIYSNEKQTNYIWDGTENGRTIPSGTYWYILEWTEPDNGAKLSFKDWILVKNRN